MAGYSVTYSVVDNATKQIDAINRRITAMRAPMDRLSKQVSKFVDVSGLNTIAKGFASIGRAALGVLRTLVEIVPVLGTITGAATIAGMAKLVGSYANWSQQLTATADNLGMTTQQLQQFEDATRLAGGKTSDMDEALKALYKTQTDFVRGQASSDQIGWLNRLGINVKDANGHLRAMADLMPEVEQKIAAIQNPADRAAASAALLGDANGNLVETFRRSHQSFGQWMTDANRYTELSDQQKSQLQAFSEAQGRIATDFDHLGQQISATLAKNFTPLINKLSEFVEKHTPEILAAVDRISAKFAAWLEGIKWDDVEKGLQSFMDGLTWITTHLNEIKTVAEIIAGIFVAKWGVQAVTAIGQVVSALGTVGGGAGAAAAGGTGLLGALGAVAGIATALASAYAVKKGLEAGSDVIERKAFGSDRVDDVRKMQEEGHQQFLRQIPSWLGGTGGALGGLGTALNRAWKGPAALNQVAPPSDLNLPSGKVERGAAITDRLAADLNLTKEQASGITGNLQAESGLQAVQERNPIGGGRGGFGWAQWTGPRRDAFEAYAKANKLDPKSDEANYGFLMTELKSPEYAKMLAQLRDTKGPDVPQQSARVVESGFERPAVSNAAVRGKYASQFAAAAPPPVAPAAPSAQVAQASAPPAVVPPPAPANGNVDVNITGKNMPPNTAITASASGQGVKAAPPRVEYQEMASI